MTTRGEAIAGAVREHLFSNGLKQSQLTGAMLAEIANRVLAHWDNAVKKKKRLASEEEWLTEMQDDPAMKGVDVRRALAEAQFWAKNNSRVCTQKFFTNWLLNPKNRPILNGGGPTSAVAPKAGPKGWLEKLNEIFPGCIYARGGMAEIQNETEYQWQQLDGKVRDQIRRAM